MFSTIKNQSTSWKQSNWFVEEPPEGRMAESTRRDRSGTDVTSLRAKFESGQKKKAAGESSLTTPFFLPMVFQFSHARTYFVMIKQLRMT